MDEGAWVGLCIAGLSVIFQGVTVYHACQLSGVYPRWPAWRFGWWSVALGCLIFGVGRVEHMVLVWLGEPLDWYRFLVTVFGAFCWTLGLTALRAFLSMIEEVRREASAPPPSP
jgi:hypothetical protein